MFTALRPMHHARRPLRAASYVLALPGTGGRAGLETIAEGAA
ncbi:hypothetical protein ACIQ6Y_37355 [Streptomyces sp. NPDC096205]